MPLRRVAARLRALADLVARAPVPIAVAHDPDCRFITANDALARLLGVESGINISMTPPPARCRPTAFSATAVTCPRASCRCVRRRAPHPPRQRYRDRAGRRIGAVRTERRRAALRSAGARLRLRQRVRGHDRAKARRGSAREADRRKDESLPRCRTSCATRWRRSQCSGIDAAGGGRREVEGPLAGDMERQLHNSCA